MKCYPCGTSRSVRLAQRTDQAVAGVLHMEEREVRIASHEVQ